MAIAAVPIYMGDDFTSASPGHRFGMYLELWGTDQKTGQLLWSTHDVNYRVAGKNRVERAFNDENKSSALKASTDKLSASDTATMEALAARQSVFAQTLESAGQLCSFPAISSAPFVTGLGNEHPLENGFSFLNPYGLPYLPGSAVKGVLRQAARELSSELFEAVERDGWTTEDIQALFGVEDGEGDPCRGALSFWDVIPQLRGDKLGVEVMTPHQSHYYQNGESPHDSGSPNPILFLSVPPGSGFVFYVQCDQSHLARIAPDLLECSRWQSLLELAFRHAFEWLGFGAKSAVGYGAMLLDERHREQQRERREQQAEDDALARRVAEQTNALPDDAAELKKQQLEGKWTDNAAVLDALEAFIKKYPSPSVQAVDIIIVQCEQAWSGITTNPDATSGKKKKPKFKERPRALVKVILALQASGE